ncbi:HK97 gp10 family phage protein [Roseospirillum parvum]|uniref:Uncharacterized protein n=1 Tax=Roseospirillum parvum TaxID=83401 RepID=A0A1G8EXE8_9PROT|nr:HK97 gp10 family phage protein [Roseospirillum parvum]SDH74514.1 hypothetical protein SAMN05421742_11170 [Roseospirillum parvum]
MSRQSYRIDLAGLTALQEALATAPRIAAEELVATTWEAELYLERELKERAPVGATNLLRGSIAARRPAVTGARVVGEVGTAVAHAVPVELGSKPHRPPVAPILDWVQARLGLSGVEGRSAAFAIAGAIARRGTEGQFVFRDVWAEREPAVRRLFGAMLTRIGRRIAAEGAR